jgi:hypothetical protein
MPGQQELWPEKVCSKCRETKPRSKFHADKWASDGLRSDCALCNNAGRRKYSRENREKERVRKQKYRVENLEKERDRQRRYNEKNRERISSNVRAYNTTEAGIAKGLRNNHGMGFTESERWGKLLHDKEKKGKCFCCGLPRKMLDVYGEKGPWPPFMGIRYGRGAHRRLEFGHTVAGAIEHGGVLLCHACNHVFYTATYTPVNAVWVQRRVRKLWENHVGALAVRFLFWLHDSIDPVTGGGIGGEESMSPTKARNEAALLAMHEKVVT